MSSRIKVVLFGDSITQQSFSAENSGWGAALQNWYSRTGDVFNRGFSGYNSRWFLQSFDEIIKGIEYPCERTVVTLFLGANDLSDDNQEGKVPTGQGVNVNEYEKNMTAIVHRIRGTFGPNAILILICPPRVDNNLWPTRSNERSARYGSALKSIHASLSPSDPNLHLIDTWESNEFGCGKEGVVLSDLNDGLHLGSSGNGKIFSMIQGCVRMNSKHLAPDDDEQGQPTVKLHLPYWGELAACEGEGETKNMIDGWTW